MTISKLTGQLLYVQVDTPKPCYDVEKGTEWKSSIAVSEDDADAWNEAFPKQKAKEVKTSEYEGIYKVEPLFPDQRKQYIITLRKNTKLGNGNPVPQQYEPKVFQQKGKILAEITSSVLVANGSEGQMSVDFFDSKMGSVARLKNVKVDVLIEYVKPEGGGYESGSEFSSADDGEGNTVKVPAKAKTPAKTEVASKAKSRQVEEDSEDSSPF